MTGAYSAALRVEFTLSPAQVAEGYAPSTHGPQNGTSVQFVQVGGTANFGADVPEDYTQDGARAAAAIERANDPKQQSDVTPVLSSVVTLPWDTNSQDATVPTPEASANDQAYGTGTGSVYGLAYQRGTKNLYASAFLRRHSGLGAAGLGGVYKIDTATHKAALLVNLTAAGIDVGQAAFSAALGSPGPAGDNAARGLPGPVDQPSNDPVGWKGVGKYGLGGMAMSTDQSSLYVVNLYRKTLVKVDLASGAASEISLGSLGADERPFGVTVHRGKIYVGLVDTAEASGARGDLTASVIATPESSPGAWTAALAPVPLDYLRGVASTFPLAQLKGDIATHWNSWTDDFDATESAVWTAGGRTWITRPEPMLTGLAFDVDGNLELGFGDRHGFQTGTANYSLTPGDTTLYDGIAEGDLLTAAPHAGGTYDLESNGVRGGRTGSATGDNQGPGGGEFFFDTSKNYVHDETLMGAVASVPGYRDLLATGLDMSGSYTGDAGWVPSDGASNWSLTARLVNDSAKDNGAVGATTGFGKAGSLGGVAVLADLAPVEIGNRVWYDADGDGIQDADEPAIPGVKVTLTDAAGKPVKDAAGNPVAPVTTDASGSYYFSNLIPNETYHVSFDRSTADVSGLTPTFGVTSPTQLTFTQQTVTTTGATSSNDSNPSPTTGIASVDLGGPGQNDHTIDAGLVADT
ncbi:MAG TPA: SdrD B-like domain-containing protein, partial [Acidimicrobiales bacterium]